MKDFTKWDDDSEKGDHLSSRSVLKNFFLGSLQEMYYSENAITNDFDVIEGRIISPKLHEILKIHYAIHLKHKERLEKIFQLRNETIESKNCVTLNALLAEAVKQLNAFQDDTENWEIALILVSQKLAHYKIASYGGLAHLAIKLNYRPAATLLAVCVQEEEEYVANNLAGIFDAFLAYHVESYKI